MSYWLEDEKRWVHIGNLPRVLENIKKPEWPLPWDPKKYRDAQYGLHDLAAKKAKGLGEIETEPLIPIPRVLTRYL